MKKCSLISECALFEDEMLNSYLKLCGVLDMSKEEVKDSYVRKYCYGDYENCARYIIATELGLKKLPKSLLPSQNQLVDKLVSKGK